MRNAIKSTSCATKISIRSPEQICHSCITSIIAGSCILCYGTTGHNSLYPRYIITKFLCFPHNYVVDITKNNNKTKYQSKEQPRVVLAPPPPTLWSFNPLTALDWLEIKHLFLVFLMWDETKATLPVHCIYQCITDNIITVSRMDLF